MGVALVFLLLVCKLTVSTGTLSGLVFYANIVGANGSIFLPVKSIDALSVFIAWINLDFGIETCFYDGMVVYRARPILPLAGERENWSSSID